MTKNSTRKGLALGAIAALVFSGFSGSAANAVGVESLVQLAPTTGTEYAVVAGNSFELTANNSSNANTGNLKFLVTDVSGVIEPGQGTQGRSFALALGASVSYVASTKALTIDTSQSGIVDVITGSALVAFSQDISVSGTVRATASNTVYAVSSSTTTKKLVVTTPTTAGANLSPAGMVDTVSAIVVREPRNSTANTYVVDTGTRDTARKLVLTSPSDATRTVTVQAFVDQDGDGQIDSFENVSPVRTVTFVKASELVTTTTMSVVDGDEFLTAKVKTVPVLNGQQMLADQTSSGDFLRVGFTRQDATNDPLYNGNLAGWNDTSKEFSVTLSLTVGSNVGRDVTASGAIDAAWDGIADAQNETSQAGAAVASGSKTVTITVAGDPHGLRVGDKVTFANSAIAPLSSSELVVASVPASNSFTVNSSTASSTLVSSGGAANYDVTTYDNAPESITDRAFAGTYTAQAFIQGVAAGAKVTATAITATSAEVKLSTVQSATVQGSDSGTVKVKAGTLTVPVTITVLDADEAAVSAGRPVVVTFTGTGIKVNDKTGAQTLTTDANGQIALTVTHPTGANSVTSTITAVAENGPSGSLILAWETQAYSLVDLNSNGSSLATTRAIVAGGSYTMDLAVMDQWFAVAPSADYRLVVTGSGVVEGVRTLTDGKAAVVVTDNGFQTAMKTTVSLQKLTSAVWGAVSGTEITTNVNKNTNSVVLGADGSSLYGGTADLSSPVAAKAIVAQDRRLTTTPQPKYSESAEVYGKVQNAASSVGVAGAEVTITGPSSILFSNGSVDKIGSITVLSDGSGNFGVTLYSTTAQKDTVITVTSLGKSATTKVTFTGTTTGGVGTTLVITAPDTVAPASTLQIKAKLTDTFGNAVASAPVRVTYTGPGIAFGALPTAVDALGELAFSVLLGGGDTGTITVVVSYDQNGDGDYVDAKDLNTTKTITVGAAAPAAPSADQKVNAGSFKGYVAVYAKGYEGQRLSAKIGNDWVVVPALASNFVRVVDFTGAGVDITVRIFIDRVLTATIPLTTK